MLTPAQSFQKEILGHYFKNWGSGADVKQWDKSPVEQLPGDFKILEFAPTTKRRMWTYATWGMAQPGDRNPLEVHIFSAKKNDDMVALLTNTAHYHRSIAPLDLGHSVNFGRPWQKKSACDHGLISLPYLDGPPLEHFNSVIGKPVHFYWLIPVTPAELEYKKQYGGKALEAQFAKEKLNYIN